jgi:hypothetical protein
MKLRALPALTVLACLAGTALPAGAAATSAPIGNMVLNAYKPGLVPNSETVTSRGRLLSHGLYVATIQGTLSYYAAIDYTAIQVPWQAMCGTPLSAPMFSAPGGSGPVGNDAEFIFAQPTKLASCASVKLPVHWENLQVNLGAGWYHPKLLSAKPLNAPTASHSYEYALIGGNRPASFRLTDPDTRDDYGSLHISIRSAVGGDCTGRKYKTFKFTTSHACVSAIKRSGSAPAARHAAPALTLDQGPITRVLRGSDVPKAVNLELPSGALTASQYLAASGLRGAAVHEAQLTFKSAGFVSAAVSEFATPAMTVTSTAIKLHSPAQAEAALTAWARIVSHAQAPPGTSGTVATDGTFRRGLVVTFTPTVAGALAGVEVLAAEGEYLYVLRSVEAPSLVSQAATDQLLHAVIARG